MYGVVQREPQRFLLERAVLARDDVLNVFLAADSISVDVHELKIGRGAALVHRPAFDHEARILERGQEVGDRLARAAEPGGLEDPGQQKPARR